MDTAKCIKMYVTMDDSTDYITQKIIPNDIEFFAAPTTAGTGSEATRYAIIYHNGNKVSVTDSSCFLSSSSSSSAFCTEKTSGSALSAVTLMSSLTP